MAQVSPGAPSSNFFLDGNFSPVGEERDAQDMEVVGKIPEDLQGHFLRVGPNPVHVFSEEAYHTFDGDGMIHAIEFAGGTGSSSFHSCAQSSRRTPAAIPSAVETPYRRAP